MKDNLCSTTHRAIRDVKAVMFRVMIMELPVMGQTITFIALNAGRMLSLVHDDAYQSTSSITHAYKLFTRTYVALKDKHNNQFHLIKLSHLKGNQEQQKDDSSIKAHCCVHHSSLTQGTF